MKRLSSRRRFYPLLSLCVVASVVAEASAQRTATGRREVSLTQSVSPSFRIEPVVHRFTARRGEVIPFEFLIGSMGKEMNVTVTPVNLRQEETGIILHDGQSEPSRALRITSPRSFRLGGGQQTIIRGKLTVPLARTNYLSYGILVRESGSEPEFENPSEERTRAGIRFVTQYVLRVDVETGVADVGALSELRFERGSLVAERGLPTVQGLLTNPTNYAFECQVSAELDSDDRSARPIRLGMPSRARLEGDDRHLIRIMPNSTLRLEASFDRLIAPGDRTLRLSLATGRREVTAAEFSLNVDRADFPALATQRAILGGVSMTPAQIEIGSVRSASRAVGLKFRNTTEEPAQIEIEPRSLDDGPIDHVRFSPASFTIKPGRTKGVRAMLRRSDSESIEAAVAVVRWTREGKPTVEQRQPLSILGAEPGEPRLDVQQVRWEGDTFITQVTNRSDAYTPIAAELAVGGPSGLRLRMQAGYGRWLAPGETTTLMFSPREPLPAGDYSLILEVQTRDAFPPLVRELNFALQDDRVTADATGHAPSRG